MNELQATPPKVDRTIPDLVFVGFNSRIAALDRYTGEIVWEWKAPKGTGFPSLLLDGDRLIASVNGYTYCIDPLFGQQVWNNDMKGFGLGTTCLVSMNGSSGGSAAAAVLAQQQAAAAAAAS
ncbi:MAG: PQQ-binding-like beta-propeller repeat protein [Planctomycetota bacterium]|nr:PQQ-binding-like beta-propeller repeat protein [Planctomycetota bacterium]